MSEAITQDDKSLFGRKKWFKIPVSIVVEMLRSKSVHPLELYLENLDIADNTELIESLIEAKRDLDEGRGIPWEEIQGKYGIG